MLNGRTFSVILTVTVVFYSFRIGDGNQKTQGGDDNEDNHFEVQSRDKRTIGDSGGLDEELTDRHAEEIGDKHDSEHHHDNKSSRSDIRKVNGGPVDQHTSKQNEKGGDHSRSDHRWQTNTRKADYGRDALDDKDGNYLHSRANSRTPSQHFLNEENSAWKHLENRPNSKEKGENIGEFGYLTDDIGTETPHDIDGKRFSGEMEHDYENSGTPHVHRRLPSRKSRDRDLKETHPDRKGRDEFSGEEEMYLNEHLTRGSIMDEKGRNQEVFGEAKEGDGSWDAEDESSVERQSDGELRRKGKVHKLRRDPRTLKLDKSEYLSRDRDNDDFYIADKDEPIEKLHAVEMGYLGEQMAVGEGVKGYKVKGTNERYTRRLSRNLLQFETKDLSLDDKQVLSTECSHLASSGKIPKDSIIYNRFECRLCQCKTGKMLCEPKPELCYQRYWLGKKLCFMQKGHALADGERHFDGCNSCLCRNGELLCTRLRCPSANNSYTNYHEVISKEVLHNSTKSNRNYGRIRGTDPCLECDYELISPVCGPNWITYRSMCHALQCGGHSMERVYQGACKHVNPCDEAKCAKHEICLIRKQGPCLTSTTTDGQLVKCQQYQCVNPSQDCSQVIEGKVCGEDHQTYLNECAMLSRGVEFAYYGPCKDECGDDYSQMCGMDGVTLASSCSAALRNSHIDYPGECDDVDPQNNVIINSGEWYHNRRCKTVEDLARCPSLECARLVTPEGSCCPICGSAISVRLDTAVKDMSTLKTSPFYHLNRLSFIYSTLKSLLNDFGGIGTCELTTDLLDTNDISVVYKPIRREDEKTCEDTARKTVEYINSPTKNDADPGQAVLAAAIFVDYSEKIMGPRAASFTSLVKKRRKKRHMHHHHHNLFGNNARICPETHLLLFLVVLVLLFSEQIVDS